MRNSETKQREVATQRGEPQAAIRNETTRKFDVGANNYLPLLIALICLFVSLAFASRDRTARRQTNDAPPQARPLVLTSVPAIYAIGKELLAGTDVEIALPFGNEISIDELENIAAAYESELDSLAKRTVAVAGVRSMIPTDMLFVQMRRRNIRTIEIDCATPLSPIVAAVGKIRLSGDEENRFNPYVWLSLSNAVRMAEVLGSDFAALFPNFAEKITRNLVNFKRDALDARNAIARRFLEIDNFNAVALTSDFDYLLKDIDLFLLARFAPEYDWDEEAALKFEKLLEAGNVGVVINRWETGDPAAGLMANKNVKTAVLRTGFPAYDDFSDGFLEFWRRNVNAILDAFEEK